MSDILHFLVPGPIDRRTGGSIYDRRIVEGLRANGVSVRVHELEGAFPDPEPEALAELDAVLGGLPDHAAAVVDGLVFGAVPDLAARHAGRIKLIALVHHPLADETGLDEAKRAHLTASERSALGHAAGIVVTSDFTRARLQDFVQGDSDIHVVVPGTDPASLAELEADTGMVRLLCVANLVPRKGHLELIEALASLVELPWRLTCVGSGALDPGHAARIAEALSRSGLSGRVHLREGLDERALDGAYRSSDIFVLPSHYEGYGMVVSEAVARGLPIVTTTGGALAQTAPVRATLFCDPGDVAGLRAALERAIAEPELRARLAVGARAARDGLADWRTAAAHFQCALETILGR